MPEPQWHLASAPLPLAIAKLGPGDADPALAALISVFVDLDHLVDVAWYRVTGDRERQLIPLHAVELLPLFLACGTPRSRGLAIGLAVHYGIDLVFGEYRLRELSIAWRLRHRLRTGWMGDWVEWPRGRGSWRAIFGLAAPS